MYRRVASAATAWAFIAAMIGWETMYSSGRAWNSAPGRMSLGIVGSWGVCLGLGRQVLDRGQLGEGGEEAVQAGGDLRGADLQFDVDGGVNRGGRRTALLGRGGRRRSDRAANADRLMNEEPGARHCGLR